MLRKILPGCLIAIMLLVGCRRAGPQPTLSPLRQPSPALSPLSQPGPITTESPSQKAFEDAVRQDLDQRLTAYLDQGVGVLQSVALTMADNQSGVWRGLVTPASCPLVSYEIIYDGVNKDHRWQLYEAENSVTNLAKAWATAYSAAHNGEPTIVPGAPITREVTLIPPAIADVLQAVLDEPDNHLVRVTAGFYLCMTDKEGYGSLSGDALARVQGLIPKVRQTLTSTP